MMKKSTKNSAFNTLQQVLFTQLKDVMNVDYRQLLARIKGLSSIKNVQTQQTVAT
ncbi:ATP-dependent RNA helicase HrpA, partial [Pasteurella multocida subsp. multocida str. Anand1_buffalo]